MGEILTIQNFGPIKDMTLDLRQVNVLIGDQGTGKSTVAKVLMAVKGLVRDAFWDHDRWIDSLENRQLTMKALMNRWKEKFAKWLELTGLTNSFNENSYISFEDKIYSFLYDAGKVNVTVSDIGHSTDETWVDTYIPAYREVAIVLKDKLFAVLQAKATLPDLLTRFGTAFLEARTRRPLYDYEQVFRVKYRHSNSNDYILLHDGKEILIEDASSAIRNGVPMLVVFDDTLNGPNNTYCPYLIIEEPELNCFPETQEKLVRYFIEHIKKEEGYSNRLFITTHSPYILTSLNNLMQAHQTGKREPEKADVIIPKEYWLSPDDVSAYLLLPNGTWKDIMNREEHLIEAEEIDSVSRKLNKEFDDLLTLEIRAEI